jgi:hypothetical protein
MTANFLNTNFVKSPFDMALGEELFEESGNITGVKVTRVHPIEGITMEVSFTSEIRGIGRVPSGKNLGSGMMTQYRHGILDASWQGLLTTAEDGEQFIWWAHEKGKIVEDGKVKGLIMVTGFTNSQKLSWMNNLQSSCGTCEWCHKKNHMNRIRMMHKCQRLIHMPK